MCAQSWLIGRYTWVCSAIVVIAVFIARRVAIHVNVIEIQARVRVIAVFRGERTVAVSILRNCTQLGIRVIAVLLGRNPIPVIVHYNRRRGIVASVVTGILGAAGQSGKGQQCIHRDLSETH
jgi:hypothetical protein